MCFFDPDSEGGKQDDGIVAIDLRAGLIYTKGYEGMTDKMKERRLRTPQVFCGQG